jgi:dTDP-4-dehydrorhamnose 3,5-epimerase
MAELSATAWNQIYVPLGFAHCCATLEDDCEVIFKLGCAYAPDHAEGLAWNDPDLAIDWPFSADQAIVLAHDLDRLRFAALPSFFDY